MRSCCENLCWWAKSLSLLSVLIHGWMSCLSRMLAEPCQTRRIPSSVPTCPISLQTEQASKQHGITPSQEQSVLSSASDHPASPCSLLIWRTRGGWVLHLPWSRTTPSSTPHSLVSHSTIVIPLLLSGYCSSEWNQSARICNYGSGYTRQARK